MANALKKIHCDALLTVTNFHFSNRLDIIQRHFSSLFQKFQHNHNDQHLDTAKQSDYWDNHYYNFKRLESPIWIWACVHCTCIPWFFPIHKP